MTKHSDQPTVQEVIVEKQDTLETITGFWSRNSKQILIAVGALLAIAGGVIGYKILVSEPNIKKANEALFRAETFFRQDSLQLALKGDAVNPGFEKIITKYAGTEAANLAHYYAGASYLRLGDFNNAIKHLKDFSTGSKQIQARATALLADAYAESGKKEEAAPLYMKAGQMFPEDAFNSSEYLYRAGLLFESLNKSKDAVAAFKLIKEKYPRSERGFEVDKYLAKLGETE
jgi:predicted negative regulator of RcsB-dependent stress response